MTATPRGPAGPHPAHEAHRRMVAASRARLEAANRKAAKNRARGINKALQRAAARFLPPGTELSTPRVLDLERWPYAGDQKVLYDVPQPLRNSILEEDALCVWCRQELSTTIDHVHPLNRGGTNHPLNLVGACGACNYIKGDFLPKELGWVLRLPRRAFALAALPA
ncbi:HNH endonuclease [Pseudarthrobacter sp. BIM B-2242]|uniref:HNH endonuclease n=1 Tax=Pseudarthrobacter sp. BIM B-2242 TaxID=2772401 RepID=UPI00168B5B3C|nr:HNH endonuclease [Pseudarthrobacter sp. BIM B-2242]QOD05977.1 HNH endonuclease [Pseudarthrobacter sp. BIM B-2242]